MNMDPREADNVPIVCIDHCRISDQAHTYSFDAGTYKGEIIAADPANGVFLIDSDEEPSLGGARACKVCNTSTGASTVYQYVSVSCKKAILQEDADKLVPKAYYFVTFSVPKEEPNAIDSKISFNPYE